MAYHEEITNSGPSQAGGSFTTGSFVNTTGGGGLGGVAGVLATLPMWAWIIGGVVAVVYLRNRRKG